MFIGIGPGIALGIGGGNPYQLFQLNGILGTGQSLSIGQSGTPVLSETQPYDNLMFEGGVVSLDTEDLVSLVPLIEGVGLEQETPMSSMANMITSLAVSTGREHDALAACAGQGSTAYVFLSKGQVLYAKTIAQVTAGVARAAELGKTFGITGFMIVHGESDADIESEQYDTDIVQWQIDYEGDILPITGQRGPIPHFHSQMSSSAYAGGTSIRVQQLAAHIAAPGLVILIGPKYHLPYADAAHLTNEGYRQLGVEFAKVYNQVVILGRTWEPLRPRSVSIDGAVITIQFYVPVAPLVFDTDLVDEIADMGFEWDGDGETITDVSIVGDDTVEIILNEAPVIPGQIRYAQGEDSAGNLRDSDATPSLHEYALHNWCVHFDETVTP